MVILVLAFLIVTGMALLIVGRRGVAIDDHRLCRRCGFDLSGTPAVAVCGECGADLRRADSVRVGHRRRRRGLMATGGSLLVPSLLVAGVIGWGRVNGVDWRHYAPLGYLLREAASVDPAHRSPALAELTTRSADGRLKEPDWGRVADVGLEYQKDLAKPWDGAWGDLLESMRSTGQLSDDRWTRYATQGSANVLGLVVRPRVRRGDVLPWSIRQRQARVSSRSDFWIEIDGDRLTWAGQPAGGPTAVGRMMAILTSTSASSFNEMVEAGDFPPGLIEGPQLVRATARVLVGRANAGVVVTPLVTTQLDLPAAFVLQPAGEPSVTMVQDPSLAEAIRAAIGVRLPALKGQDLTVDVNGPPEGLSFVIFARDAGGVETNVGTVACPARTTNTVYSLSWPPALIGKPVDVIFRYDPKVAAGTVDVMRAWDGEIVFKNVK